MRYPNRDCRRRMRRFGEKHEPCHLRSATAACASLFRPWADVISVSVSLLPLHWSSVYGAEAHARQGKWASSPTEMCETLFRASATPITQYQQSLFLLKIAGQPLPRRLRSDLESRTLLKSHSAKSRRTL